MKTNRYIMSRNQLRTVWQQASWPRVIELFGLEIDGTRRSKQDELWIRSPFTNESTASLHVNLTENIYKDFSGGSGARKGILTFCQEMLKQKGQDLNCYEVGNWMLDNGVSTAAISHLNHTLRPERTGIRDEKEKKESGWGPVNQPIDVDLRPFLQADHPELQRRGLSKITCRYLGCGYLPARKGRQSPLNGRIVFQVRGISSWGDGWKPCIISHVGRALTPTQAERDGKYWSFPFRKGCEIYNQDTLLLDRNARRQVSQLGLILVEGYFDVASLIESGCLNVGALMGARISSQHIARLKMFRARLDIPKILLFLDRDDAGIEGTQEAVRHLKDIGFTVESFDWEQTFCRPDGSIAKIPENIKDPSDMSTSQLQWLRARGII